MSNTGGQQELPTPDPERIRQAIDQDEPIGSTELKRWLAWQQEEMARLKQALEGAAVIANHAGAEIAKLKEGRDEALQDATNAWSEVEASDKAYHDMQARAIQAEQNAKDFEQMYKDEHREKNRLAREKIQAEQMLEQLREDFPGWKIENAGLREERNALLERAMQAEQERDTAIKQLESSLKVNDALLEGLKWYAGDDPGSEAWGRYNPCNDGGSKARSIIGKIEGGKSE